MPHNVDEMLLRAKLKALRNKNTFLKKWAQYPAALPSIIRNQLPKQQEQEKKLFNQSEDTAFGGVSGEARNPFSDRISATGIDTQGNDA